MRARTGLSIFCLALTWCGARTELAGRPATDAAVEVSADVVVVESCEMGLFSISRTASRPDTIALDGAWVYWHDETGVFRIDKNGGAPEALAELTPSFWPDLAAFAIGGGHLFYGSGDTIVFDGNAIGNLASPGFAASSSHVYAWSRDTLPSPIYRFAFDGTGGATSASFPEKTSVVTFQSVETICAAQDPGVECGGQLLSGLDATDLVVTASDVWFTSNDSTNGARVMHLELPSLKTTPLADTTGAFAITTDGDDLFFTDGKAHRIERIAGKTGPVTTLAKGGDAYAPIDVAVDAKCVYWTDAPTAANATGWVMAAPKK